MSVYMTSRCALVEGLLALNQTKSFVIQPEPLLQYVYSLKLPRIAERVFWYHYDRGYRSGNFDSQIPMAAVAQYVQASTSSLERAYEQLRQAGLMERISTRNPSNPLYRGVTITRICLPPQILSELLKAPDRKSSKVGKLAGSPQASSTPPTVHPLTPAPCRQDADNTQEPITEKFADRQISGSSPARRQQKFADRQIFVAATSEHTQEKFADRQVFGIPQGDLVPTDRELSNKTKQQVQEPKELTIQDRIEVLQSKMKECNNQINSKAPGTDLAALLSRYGRLEMELERLQAQSKLPESKTMSNGSVAPTTPTEGSSPATKNPQKGCTQSADGDAATKNPQKGCSQSTDGNVSRKVANKIRVYLENKIKELRWISDPINLIGEVLFSMEQGVQKTRPPMMAANAALKLIRENRWRTPYGYSRT